MFCLHSAREVIALKSNGRIETLTREYVRPGMQHSVSWTMLDACVRPAGNLAELESTAWKDERRFRIVVADRGALAFCELYFRPRPPAIPPTALPDSMRQQQAAAAAATPPGRTFDIVALGEPSRSAAVLGAQLTKWSSDTCAGKLL